MHTKAYTFLLIICILLLLALISFFQLLNLCLYEVDGYYHITVPRFIKESGIHYKFPYAQFSTFKKAYADKEFLFHLLLLPFTFISNDIHIQGKTGVIFFCLLFFLTFLFVQRKYVIPLFQIISLISLPFSILVLNYLNYLRPKTLAIPIVLLILYFSIEKKWLIVFLLSIIYPISHISFLFSVVLTIGIESIRYIYKKEFFIRNPLYSLLGMTIGIFIHPHFPNNLLSFHLNAILVPWNNIFGSLNLNYGQEWFPTHTKTVIIDQPILFLGIFLVLTILLTKKVEVGFHTIGFFFATGFFFFLSMFSNCYWYFTYPTGLIFLSMFFSDYLKDKSISLRIVYAIGIGIVLIFKIYEIKKHDSISISITTSIEHNSHYERMAKWMNEHIPPGEIIYHTSWSDSPYFICLNPKDYYLTMLDPIYMYYYNKDIYNLYNNLSGGFTKTPVKFLRRIFKSKFVYTGKNYGLYNQLKNHKNAKLLVEDEYGAIFQLAKDKETS